MSSPRDWPIILIFTDSRGSEYGYSDAWTEEIFLYTGEGQGGDGGDDTS